MCGVFEALRPEARRAEAGVVRREEEGRKSFLFLVVGVVSSESVAANIVKKKTQLILPRLLESGSFRRYGRVTRARELALSKRERERERERVAPHEGE